MILNTEKLLLAADLMTPNPKSLRSGETVKGAMNFLIDNGFSAAPVVNEAGRAIGVLTLTDIVRYEREKIEYVQREVYESANRKLQNGERVGEGFEIEKTPSVTVDEIMTPAVFSVRKNTISQTIISRMLEKCVHRVFVTDETDVLVGVITSMDILKAFKASSL